MLKGLLNKPITFLGAALLTFSGSPQWIRADDLPESLEFREASEEQESIESPIIKGIVLASSRNKLLPPEKAKEVEGVCNVDVAIPDGTYCLNDRLYKKVLNAPFCKEWLEEVKREIMQYYKDSNRPFMIVEVPEQEITNGVVQLVVKEGKIGKIVCTGNEYYPQEYFADLLGLKEGRQILYDVLSESVAWLGMHPFSQAELIFKPGKNEGEVDVEIIATDRKPWRIYAGADNSGTKATSYGRLFGGAMVDNVFKAGGVLLFQYKGSDDFKKMQSYLLSYMTPLRCGNILQAYGGYAKVQPKIHSFTSTGRFAQASFFYSIPIKWRLCQWVNNIGFGVNYKRLNTNLFFIDNPKMPIIDGGVNLTQLLLSYDLGRHRKNHSVTFNSKLYFSPGHILPGESNHDYNALQNGAHSLYAYLSSGGEYILYLPHEFTLTIKGALQASTGTLLSSEQFPLGGQDNIRGYVSGEYLADNALLFSSEIFFPPINMNLSRKIKSYLLFSAFVDSGLGNQYHQILGTKKTDYLIGVGPGLRYKIDPYLEVELDWGFKLHKVEGGSTSNQRLDFNITACY